MASVTAIYVIRKQFQDSKRFPLRLVFLMFQDCLVNVNIKNDMCRVQGCHDRHIVSELLHLAKQIDLPTAQKLFQATKAVEGFGQKKYETFNEKTRKPSNISAAESSMMYTVYCLVWSRYHVCGLKEEVVSRIKSPFLGATGSAHKSLFMVTLMETLLKQCIQPGKALPKKYECLLLSRRRAAQPFYLSLSLEFLRWCDGRLYSHGNALSRHPCFSIHP